MTVVKKDSICTCVCATYTSCGYYSRAAFISTVRASDCRTLPVFLLFSYFDSNFASFQNSGVTVATYKLLLLGLIVISRKRIELFCNGMNIRTLNKNKHFEILRKQVTYVHMYPNLDMGCLMSKLEYTALGVQVS